MFAATSSLGTQIVVVVVGALATGAILGVGYLLRRLIEASARVLTVRLDALETRLCSELAANTSLTATAMTHVAHQGAQIAYLQGRLRVPFRATANAPGGDQIDGDAGVELLDAEGG